MTNPHEGGCLDGKYPLAFQPTRAGGKPRGWRTQLPITEYAIELGVDPSSFILHLSSFISHPFNSRLSQARPLLPISFVRLQIERLMSAGLRQLSIFSVAAIANQ